MAILGSTAKPTTNQEAWGLNSKNQFASLVTLPAGGPWRIYQVGVWCAGWNATPTGRVAVWTSGASYARGSATFTIANGGGLSLGTAFNYVEPLTSDYVVAGGTSVYVGFVRDGAEGIQFPVTGSGTHLEDTTSSEPSSMSGYNSHAGTLGAYLYYEASNTIPTAPTLVSPASGARIVDGTPVLDWSHNDADGDAQAKYQVQVDDSSGFGTPTHDTGAVISSATSYTLPAGVIDRGETRWWRVRTADAAGFGPYSVGRSMSYNRLPTVTRTSPTSAGLSTITNLATDTAVWTSGGAHAKPRFKWTFTDLDGDAQNAYVVKIYSASSGGTLLYNSGYVYSSAKQHDATWAGVYGTEYWWTVQVRDAYNEWSAESSPRWAFRMKFGQAIYEHAVPGGASSSNWAFGYNFTGTGQLGFMFASASGANGSGRSAWKTSIGQVTPNNYLNVLVREGASVAGVTMALADMTFSYLASGIQPERWTFGTVSTDWILDPEQRRYGSQSLRCTRSTTTGERVAYPFTKLPDDDFLVSANTEYTASVYVKTDVPLTDGVRLEVRAKGGMAPWLGSEIIDDGHNICTDSSASPEGWQRIWVRFRTADVDGLRLAVVQDAPGVIGDKFWVDAIQLEESPIPSPWRPGMVGNAVVLDVNGIMVDASAGGIFRLRGTDGSSVAELGEQGLEFPGALVSSGTSIINVSTLSLSANTIGYPTRNPDLNITTPATGHYRIWLSANISYYINSAGHIDTFLSLLSSDMATQFVIVKLTKHYQVATTQYYSDSLFGWADSAGAGTSNADADLTPGAVVKPVIGIRFASAATATIYGDASARYVSGLSWWVTLL